MRLLLGQTGAPTAVLNRSVAGFLDGAVAHDVALVRGGPNGLVDGDLVPLAELSAGPDWVRHGGSVLGGGRRAMTSADLDGVVDVIGRAGIDGLALIGGNGTMALLRAIAERARDRGVALRTVGVPKTIDNDLPGVDHAPGFASAARFLSAVLPDIARDHRAMRSIERVRIVETMGRATGWLALAAAAPDPSGEPVAHLVLTPESAPEPEQVLDQIDAVVRREGRALVVVSEGVLPELSGQPVHASNHTRLIAGGIARLLGEQVSRRLGHPTRAEVLGVVQRSAAELASPVDVREAYAVGHRAATALTEPPATGADRVPDLRADADSGSGVMVAVRRSPGPGYRVEHPLVPLSDAAGVRTLPTTWHGTDPSTLTDFYDWLRPLVQPTSSLDPSSTPTAAMEAS